MKNLRQTTFEHENGSPLACVQVSNGDCLVFVCIILDNAFSKDVKQLSMEDIIGWVLNNVNLQVQSDIADKEQNVAYKAQ